MQGVDLPRCDPDQQLGCTDLQQHRAFLGSQTHLGDDIERADTAAADVAHAPREPGAQKNGAEHDAQRKGDLSEAGYAGHRRTGGGARCRKHVSERVCRGGVQRSFRMRSAGLMTSVRRMPNFSFTTTTSPWAMRVPLTNTSSGSPATRSSSTTEPWLSCRRLRIGTRVRPTSMDSVTGTSRITSMLMSLLASGAESGCRLSNSAVCASGCAAMDDSSRTSSGKDWPRPAVSAGSGAD